jgi:hypothetical protein
MKRIPKGQSRIDNSEKPTIYGTQDEDNAICAKKKQRVKANLS